MITRVIVVLLVLALPACNDPSKINSSVSVITVSGAQVSLNGTYTTGCRTKSGVDVIEGIVINGGTWTYARDSYTTSDGSCGGTATTASSIIATLSSSGAAGAIAGWSDSGVTATAPTAADSSGPLSNTESYTVLTLTATAVTGTGAYTLASAGDTVNCYYIFDDTGLPNRLYIPDFNAVDHMLSATPSGSFMKL